MGGNSSREYYAKQQAELELNAARNYHKRVTSYNYAYHGPYYDYIELCRAQYQLECLPQCCRQGSGYSGWNSQDY
jgi:hypothetical protein